MWWRKTSKNSREHVLEKKRSIWSKYPHRASLESSLVLQIQNVAKLHKVELWKVRLSTTRLSSEKVGLSVIQFVKPVVRWWRSAARQWPSASSGGEESPGGDSLELPISHFTDTTPNGVEMVPGDDDADRSKMAI